MQVLRYEVGTINNLIQDLERYLKEVLDICATPKRWQGEKRLPYFLRDIYAFYQVSLLDIPCLLMVPRAETQQTPAAIRKHMRALEEKWECVIIYVDEAISAHNRKRLIEHKVPFVIPGNQMFLLPLGIDLRERFRPIRKTRAHSHVSPSTQAVLLQALLRDASRTYTPSQLADLLRYTPMTLTRALNELDKTGLGEVAMEGRERILRFHEDKRALWERVREFVSSPVKRRVWAPRPACERYGVRSGLTALAHYSMLAPPDQPAYAVSAEGWKAMRQHEGVAELPNAEPDTCELEIWSYSPRMFAQDNYVDRLSLYLSLQGSTDERVEAALDEMMETMTW